MTFSNSFVSAASDTFVSAARDDFEIASAKEAQIGSLRDELNADANKLNAIANMAVVAKSVGLDNPSFKGRHGRRGCR